MKVILRLGSLVCFILFLVLLYKITDNDVNETPPGFFALQEQTGSENKGKGESITQGLKYMKEFPALLKEAYVDQHKYIVVPNFEDMENLTPEQIENLTPEQLKIVENYLQGRIDRIDQSLRMRQLSDRPKTKWQKESEKKFEATPEKMEKYLRETFPMGSAGKCSEKIGNDIIINLRSIERDMVGGSGDGAIENIKMIIEREKYNFRGYSPDTMILDFTNLRRFAKFTNGLIFGIQNSRLSEQKFIFIVQDEKELEELRLVIDRRGFKGNYRIEKKVPEWAGN